VSLGGALYTDSGEPPYNIGVGGTSEPDPFVTRGAWVGLEAQHMVSTWLAIAARGRMGWLRRGPPTAPDFDLPAGSDTHLLDPQLGDGPVGGAAAAFARFFSGGTAIDAGATASFGSFAPRFGSESIWKGDVCGDCTYAQGAFGRAAVWPTLRISSTGPGFFFAVGTGESFVRTYEPGVLEVLFGHRGDNFEFMAGLARGLALRTDFRLGGDDWLSIDLSSNPFNGQVPGYGSLRSIATVTFTRRSSSFAPL
jgi:hypothetical protein